MQALQRTIPRDAEQQRISPSTRKLSVSEEKVITFRKQKVHQWIDQPTAQLIK